MLIGAIGTLLVAFPIYFLLQSASFGVLVGMMIIGGILPTMSWAALGGLLSELFDGRFRYAAISFAYAVAAIVSAASCRRSRSASARRPGTPGGTRPSCSR